MLYGVYRSNEGEPVVQEAREPITAKLRGFFVKINSRIMRGLARQGYLVEVQGMICPIDIDLDAPESAFWFSHRLLRAVMQSFA